MERFADIIEAVGQLPVDDQLALVEILRNRLSDHERKDIVADVQRARFEFEAGGLDAKSASAIVEDISDAS